MFEDVCGGLCVCWLLPLALLGGVVLLSNAVGVAWRNRGLERGAVYCSGCRFNLQGCASWNCPECGAHLDEGRVMTPGEDWPLGVVSRVLLVAGGAVGPLILIGVLLVWAVPVNYATSRTLELSPDTEAGVNWSQLDLQGYGESAWFGRGKPEMVTMHVARTHTYTGGKWLDYSYDPPLAGSDESLLTEYVWGRVVEQCGLGGETQAWRDAARAELSQALRYMAGEFGGARPSFAHYHFQEHTRRRFEPDGLFVLLTFLLGLVSLGLVVRWTVRWHGRVVAVYLERHGRLAEKVNEWIGRNREKAGLDCVESKQ